MTLACRSAIKDAPREQGAHAGLLLSQYLRVPCKDEHHTEERRGLFDVAIKGCTNSRQLYTLAFKRWQTSVRSLCNSKLFVQNRLIVGLGSDNVLETGITLHHTYGTPVIPGSALKGLASHYCHRVWGEIEKGAEFLAAGVEDRDEEDKPHSRAGKHYQTIFGTQDQAGHITFYDAWITPESSGQGGLVLDVMTPHHQEYYMAPDDDDETPPSDFDDPNPVSFLSVKGEFLIAVSCDVANEEGNEWARLALDLLLEALKYWGIGGKTNSGYGRLDTGQPGLAAAPGIKESTDRASSPPKRKPGDQVTAKRVENPDDKKGRIWFEADNGVLGVVSTGTPPDVKVGENVTLWVQSAPGKTYNFTTIPPKTVTDKQKPKQPNRKQQE